MGFRFCFLLLFVVGCNGGPGQDFVRATTTFEGTVGADKTVEIGTIDPTTRIVSVETAPASDPLSFKETGAYQFEGDHHGGALPGKIVIYGSSEGDQYRILVR